jgi:hypothetical protein
MKKLFIIATLAAGVAGINAQESVFQASLTPDIAIHSKTTQINGFALNIWGENPQHSLNFGFVNGSTGDSQGLSWGLLNYDDSYTGVQWGIVNYSKTSFIGWQGGVLFCPCLVNVSKGYFKGFQEGLINFAEDAHGLQFGGFNYAEKLNGLQIGFINIINSNGWFDDCPDKLAKGFPFVNWSF